MEEKKELFHEVDAGYTMLEAINEAKRCLHCKVPQCQKGCPISHDIPDWIHELSRGNLGNAMKIINDKSNLPAVCGRVCPHEKQCEGHCVLAKKGQGIHVGKLERFIADFDGNMGLIREKLQPKTRGRVAVIGSGPAGLTIAGDLARQGFNVEIFEMEPEPGGVLMFGIPEYRLPKDVVRREIKKIEELGVVFHCNTTIGTDLNIDQLFEQGFDAIFMGTGTVKPRKPDIPGRNLRGVRQAVYFLRKVSLFNEGSIEREDVPVQVGDRVFVLGCGNTAMDAARTAIRMGARDVEIIYHKTINEMSALRSEYEEAVAEGVKFNWESTLVEILDFNVGVLFFMAASSIGIVGILLAGWSSNSKFSLIGAMRSGAQMISYELSVGLSILTIVVLTDTMQFSEIVMRQADGWFIFKGHIPAVIAFIIYLIAGNAEVNRGPFDLPEAESELTAGYHTEYSGMHFGLFYVAEFVNLFIISSVAATIFLGGWMPLHIPGLDGFNAVMDAIPGFIWFFAKAFFIVWLLMWIKWTFPRLRIDQILTLEWKYLVPIGLVNLLLMVIVVVFKLHF